MQDVFGFVLHPARRSGVPVHVGMYCVQGCFFFGPLIVFLWITVRALSSTGSSTLNSRFHRACSTAKCPSLSQLLPGSAHTDWSHYPIGVLQMGHIYTLTTSFAGPSLCTGDFARLLANQLRKVITPR